MPAWTFELKCFADMLRGLREGLHDLVVEQANTQTPYGAVILKRVGIGDPARQLFAMELGAAIPLIRETGWSQ